MELGDGSLPRLLERVIPRPPEWEYVPEGWSRADAAAAVRGWNVPGVVEAYRAKLPAFVQAIEGSAPLGVSTSPAVPVGAPSVWEQNAILSYAYVLALAGRKTDSVSILDWGGGVGFSYFLSKAILPDVAFDYHCKDVAAVVSYGREVLPEAHFYDDDSCFARRYDLVVASSSLQYSEHWAQVLDRLAQATTRYLYVARLPVVLRSPSFVVLQRAARYGLGTEYLSWALNRDELLRAAARSGLELVREFLVGYRPRVKHAPEQDESRGFLFQPIPGEP